ncbi:lipopolysaccharide biosynthesis protein [Aquimarina algicola]|uniref:Uncharacterized protein n=1 Tax=Aquimarina algicola TaxID=2589995 RepID=A0A504JMG8_9FLAO|nr:oligosaccharide flippase family protein [Aquimarina algicola]TPN87881.1 hypothetical protein FHK87_09925 [Aquimarina algicola]
MKAIKSTGILLLSEILSKGIAFLLVPLYSYVVEPKDFGKVAILQLLFTVFFLIVSFSLNSTFDKYFFDKKFKSTDSLFSTILVVQILAVVFGSSLYILLGSKLALFLEIKNALYLDLVFYTSIIAVFFPVVNSYLICSGQIKRAGIYAILISMIRSTMALVLVLNMKDKILAIILANFVEHLSGLILSLPYYFKRLKLRLIEKNKIRELIVYSCLFFPSSFSVFFVKFSDRLMIQYFLNYQSLGIYSMGTRLVNIPGQFISTINKNFTPQMYQSISENDTTKLNQLIRLFLAAIFVLLSGLILFSKELFLIIGGDYKNAYTVFIILSLCSYFNGYNLIIQPVKTYFKKYVKYKSMIWVSIGVINIILNIIFIPIYGINGAAAVTAISYLISIPFSYYYARKAYKENYYLKWFMLSSVVLFSISLLLIFYKNENSILEFFIRLLSFLLIGYIFLSKLIDIREWSIKLHSFIIKKIRAFNNNKK